MARTTKKRAKQLKHDKFRDTTYDVYGRLSHRFEGRERTILYAVGGAVALVALLLVFNWWREQRADAARLALGKAIEIAEAPVSATPDPNATGPTFKDERERAQKAVEAFQKVQSDYGSPYNEIARYFAAANLLTVDRQKGLSELEALSKNGGDEVAGRAKFALAQAREADAQYDQAAAGYQELLNDKNRPVPENAVKLRLASVYEKQGKKDEAVNLLFQMVESARKAQGKDGKPLPESNVTRSAADKLQELSPERYAQLPPPPPRGGPF
ncbi:MAG TPA: tetratricopeptide repeat protein [Pyrinomonadaceae bacterium]|nr:tetratricopeptide repeat protein [Pyrinomonadaceae bacterium]